jgi:glutathionylspermidine synthase
VTGVGVGPAWKMLLSNKAMLVDMWKYNPNHPLLLETYASNEGLTGRYAKKAIHGREGANVYQTMLAAGQKVYENLGQGSKVVDDYDKWGYVYQEWFELKDHAGNKPIIGSWVIDNKACGMSVREDTNLITGDNAHFASHIMVPYDLEDRYRHYFE